MRTKSVRFSLARRPSSIAAGHDLVAGKVGLGAAESVLTGAMAVNSNSLLVKVNFYGRRTVKGSTYYISWEQYLYHRCAFLSPLR